MFDTYISAMYMGRSSGGWQCGRSQRRKEVKVRPAFEEHAMLCDATVLVDGNHTCAALSYCVAAVIQTWTL